MSRASSTGRSAIRSIASATAAITIGADSPAGTFGAARGRRPPGSTRRITSNGMGVVRGRQAARETRTPRSSARWRISPRNRVLPTPGSPSTTKAAPRPARVRSIRSSARASSGSRFPS